MPHTNHLCSVFDMWQLWFFLLSDLRKKNTLSHIMDLEISLKYCESSHPKNCIKNAHCSNAVDLCFIRTLSSVPTLFLISACLCLTRARIHSRACEQSFISDKPVNLSPLWKRRVRNNQGSNVTESFFFPSCLMQFPFLPYLLPERPGWAVRTETETIRPSACGQTSPTISCTRSSLVCWLSPPWGECTQVHGF